MAQDFDPPYAVGRATCGKRNKADACSGWLVTYALTDSLNRRELRVTFTPTRRIGTTPFRALHAEQVITLRASLEVPQPLRRRHRRHHAVDNVDALQQRIPRNTTRVADQLTL